MFVGVDIGGMSIKAGVVDGSGKILSKASCECNGKLNESEIADRICDLATKVANDAGFDIRDAEGIGIGCPGSIYDEEGIVRYSCNLNLKNAPLAKDVKDRLGVEVKLGNDANCAALGETLFGAGKGCKNTVMITLGTGVGTGIVADGRLVTGNRSAGAEGGHIQLSVGGAKCGCDKRGHFEAYASATALMRMTAEAAKRHPESLLAKLAEGGISGKTAFEAARAGDRTAKAVVNRYLTYVGMGLVSLANIFYPEKIIIGGGISNEGDAVMRPLQKYVSENVYGAEYNPKIEVVAATLRNNAGIVGAAALFMTKREA